MQVLDVLAAQDVDQRQRRDDAEQAAVLVDDRHRIEPGVMGEQRHVLLVPTAQACWSSAAMATRAGASCSSAESRATCCARHPFLSCLAADAWQCRDAD